MRWVAVAGPAPGRAGSAAAATYDDPVSSATVGVGDDDFVTGEAVALDLPPASIGSRILSGFLDYLIVWVATFTLVSAGTALSRQLDDALIAATVLVCFLTAWLVYPITIETLTRGRSLGKMAAGLRTVRDDAGPITFRHAFTRGLLGVVEVYLFWGIPAVIASIMSSRGKRLGDMLAGTYVVRDRVTAQLPPPVPMPPHLASWAMNADITQLPDDLAMAVRTFLPAAPTMTPEARDEMGRKLLAEMSLYVSPPPPAGTTRSTCSPPSSRTAGAATPCGWRATPPCGSGSPPPTAADARAGARPAQPSEPTAATAIDVPISSSTPSTPSSPEPTTSASPSRDHGVSRNPRLMVSSSTLAVQSRTPSILPSPWVRNR